MAVYKDEIYVTWDGKAGNIINNLYDVFATDGKLQKLDVHIFLHQSKLRDQRLVEWPENFIFHFTATSSPNALQTSLIAYVLEKFERISRELELDEVAEKSRIFFIQDSTSQFEELKTMLYRIPYIKSSFTFKLLSLTEDLNAEMLFQVSSNKSRHSLDAGRLSINSNETFNVYDGAVSPSPRSVRHGRRASDFPSKSPSLLTPSTSLSPRSSTNSVGSNCKHCDRRRGSQPKFDSIDKKLFCMACFLDDKTDKDLCRICQRNMHFTSDDKATMISGGHFSKEASIQCELPVHEFKDTGTQASGASLKTVYIQTEMSIPHDLSDELQGKLDALMREIELSRQQPNVSLFLPELELPQSDDPFRLSEAKVNPVTNKFDCPFCEGKSFAKVSIFEVHLRNVHKKCNCSCERYFPSREDYLDHFYSVFPLPCFEQRKCPERFRSIPYQAIHHAKVHFAERPYCCVVCFDSQLETHPSPMNGNNKKVSYRFKSIRALQIHAKDMGHEDEDLFLRVQNNEENSQVPLTGRASAINYSGEF
jgi:hypothetical protein